MTDVRIAVVFALIGSAGFMFLASERRFFNRLSLTQRLAPFLASDGARPIGPRPATWLDAVLPNFSRKAQSFARLVGVNEPLDRRLARARDERTVISFRARQLTLVIAGLVIGVVAAALLRPPPFVTVFFTTGAPLLTFLWQEQSLNKAVLQRQTAIVAELPLFAEQLAMLVGAGYSTGAALSRLADRNTGVIADELSILCRRVGQGLSTERALKEWSDLAGVPQLDRLVAVLSISSGANDLGRLLSNEAAAVREQAHRQLNALMEQRAQQVWIPVTVATLIPGVIFLLIPFTQALRLFSSS